MLGIQMAVQVLDLMAEAAGRQAIAFHLEPVAVAVLRPNPDMAGPGDNAQMCIRDR